MKKIVYLDIDGTLLNKAGELSDFNREVIIQIQKQGIAVALATGRNFEEIKEIAHQLEIDQNLNYSICQNGAYVTTTDKFQPSHLNLIDPQEAKKLHDFLLTKEVFAFISDYQEQNYFFATFDLKSKVFEQNLLPKVKIKKITPDFNWTAVSMMVFECEKTDLKFFENYLKTNFQNLEVVCSQSAHRVRPLFMVNAKNTSKMTAILELNQELKISETETYFFGDGINDVEAIKKFEHSFVPISAPDYVQAVAKNLIPEAKKDGVGIKLKELFLDR